MRRGIVAAVGRQVWRSGPRWVARELGRWRQLRRAYRSGTGESPCGPVVAHLFVTSHCDLACPMCPQDRRRREDEFSTAAGTRLLTDLADLGVSAVGFTGGEPLLRPDLFALVAAARARGMATILSTNGLRLADRLPELLAAPVDTLNVSIDGSVPATHDASRGRPGSFDRTIAGVRALLAARRGRTPELVISTVVSAANRAELDGILRLAAALPAARVVLCPRHDPVPGGCRPVRWSGPPLGMELRAHPLRTLIDNSDRYLGALDEVAAGGLPPAGCGAAYTTIFIDSRLRVYRCKADLLGGQPLAALEPGAPAVGELWRSPAYAAARRSCHGCRGCFLSVNRELDWLVGGRP